MINIYILQVFRKIKFQFYIASNDLIFIIIFLHVLTIKREVNITATLPKISTHYRYIFSDFRPIITATLFRQNNSLPLHIESAKNNPLPLHISIQPGMVLYMSSNQQNLNSCEKFSLAGCFDPREVECFVIDVYSEAH